ncbi:ferredoxin-type protein NapF [Vibrio mediterranei]
MTRDEKYYKAYMEHKTISRRGLFRALANGSTRNSPVMASDDSLAAKLECQEVSRTIPRPPKAVDELLYQQICNACGDCVKACPEQVIAIEDELARLVLDYGYCSQCGECSQVCPTGALHGQDNDTGLIPQFSDGCQNALFSDCHLCQEACPKQAISITSYSLPELDKKACDGCGRCKQGCPFSAVSMALSMQ